MAFKTKMELVLSTKEKQANGKKKHKEIARKMIPCPILADFGIDAVFAVHDADDKEKGIVKGSVQYEDGIPLYADPVKDWLQQAIAAKVAAMVRNRFVKGELKQGAILPEDFDQLTAETQRTGEALALRRDAKASFEAYLMGKNKKAATVQVLGELFYNSAKVLASAGDKYVEALSEHVKNWIPTLEQDKLSRFAPKIAELELSINNAKEQADLDDDLAA